MEYCITILLRHFKPEVTFTKPPSIRTVWGEAIRSHEEGMLLWENGIYVQLIPAIPYMLRHISQLHLNQDWSFLKVGNQGPLYANFLAGFEQSQSALEQQISLVSMFRHLLRNQAEWVVFVQRNCDQSTLTKEQTLDELSASLKQIYDPESLMAQGFCSLSPRNQSDTKTF